MNKQQNVMAAMRNFQRVLNDVGATGHAIAEVNGESMSIDQDGRPVHAKKAPAKKATKKAASKKSD